MRLLAGRRGRGSLDLVVEQIHDVVYLKKLNFAGALVYNGVGLPRETLVIVDRNQGYWLATDTDAAGGAELKEIYPDTGFFCVGLEDQRELWCRVTQPRSNGLPVAGARVRVFGWIKWNSQIMEVLELAQLAPKT